MLAGPPERLEEAFGLLDPTQRALLELSLHREVADPALAELLRTDVDTVVQQRTQSLERLADVLEASPEDVEATLVEHWRGGPEEEAAPEEEEPEEEEPEAAGSILQGGRKREGRRGLWALITVAAAIALVLLLVLPGGGDDEEDTAAPQPTQPTQPTETNAPPPQQAGEPVQLQSVLGDGNASGTARLVGAKRIVLRVRGLSDENYAVWLYNSIGEARSIASFEGPEATVRAPLPDGYERFGSIDVSREPPDGNRNHSGESVLRVATQNLR